MSIGGLGLVLLVIALLVAFTAQTIFSAFRVSNEVDESLLQSGTPRINQDKLDSVYSNLNTKVSPPLDAPL